MRNRGVAEAVADSSSNNAKGVNCNHRQGLAQAGAAVNGAQTGVIVSLI
jgi:hypothetical protein